MDKDNINKNQINFLACYARTLDPEESAKLAGYKSIVSKNALVKILDKPSVMVILDKIINEKANKLEITKAFVVKKYLKLIDYAFCEEEGKLKDPQLGLRALDGLCKQYPNTHKSEDYKGKKSIFDSIEGLDPDKI